jgi:putative hemolysin
VGADGWSAGTLGWTVGALLPAAVLVSVISALLERSGPIRLSHWAEEAGGRLRALYDQPLRFGVFRSLLSLGGRLLPVALFAALAALLAAAGARRPVAASLTVVLALLAAVEVANRALVGRDAERALRALTAVYRAALLVLGPLVTMLAAALAALVPSSRLGRREESEEEEAASDEEVEAFIDVGTREGIIEPEQGRWLSNIVDFSETQARSVMTPRIDMVCAPVEASLDELAERFLDSGHSRIPLYQESIDHIVGVLHIRDLLRALRAPRAPQVAAPRSGGSGGAGERDEGGEGGGVNPSGGGNAARGGIAELLKPPLFIPETKPLDELLRELQTLSQQMAIVVDEYGGTAGLVTVEDLVEEIVGEISDEHEDGQAAEITPLGEGAWRLDGRTHLEALDRLFEVEIEDAEYETVAGLIFSALGHLPKPGETVEREGLRFTVEEVAGRRIKALRVERLPPAPDAAPAREGAEG